MSSAAAALRLTGALSGLRAEVGTRRRQHARTTAAAAHPVAASGVGTAAADEAPGESFTLRCPHFATCSGCSKDTELNNPRTLERARDFFTECGVLDFSALTGQVHGWRNRARLAARCVGNKIASEVGGWVFFFFFPSFLETLKFFSSFCPLYLVTGRARNAERRH